MKFQKGNQYGKLNKGRKHTKESKEKIRKNHVDVSGNKNPMFGKYHSIISKQKISEKNKGKIPWNKCKKRPLFSEEWKNNIRKGLKGINIWSKGENNPNWRGGISFEPYSIDWIETLKRSIRERDRYTCRICGKEPAIDCHHIDYNKKNCNPNNLITLCHQCHMKTNFNRNYWLNYFRNNLCV